MKQKMHLFSQECFLSISGVSKSRPMSSYSRLRMVASKGSPSRVSFSLTSVAVRKKR